jgi:hypothetical protein
VKACAQREKCPPPQTSTDSTPAPTGPKTTPKTGTGTTPAPTDGKTTTPGTGGLVNGGPPSNPVPPGPALPPGPGARGTVVEGPTGAAPQDSAAGDCASARAAYAAAVHAYDAAARHASITEHAADLANRRADEAEGAYAATLNAAIRARAAADAAKAADDAAYATAVEARAEAFMAHNAPVNAFTASAAADQAAADKADADARAANKAYADAVIAAGKAAEAFRAARTALDAANAALADANAIAKAAVDALSAAEAVLDAAKAAVDAACAPKGTTPTPGGGGGSPGGTTAGGTCPACDGLRSELSSIESKLDDYRNLYRHVTAQIDSLTDKLDGYTKKELNSPQAATDKARLQELRQTARAFESKIRELAFNADKLRAAIERCEKACVPGTGATPGPGGTGTIPGGPTPAPGGAGAGGNCPACDGLRKELRDIELMLRVYQEWFENTAATMRGYTDRMLKGPLSGADLAKLDGLGNEAKQLEARIRELTDNADKLRAAIEKCDKACAPPGATPQPPKPVTPSEPTADDLRRAQQLFGEQPAPANAYVPLPQPPTPAANAVIPVRPQPQAQQTATIPGRPQTPMAPPVSPTSPTPTTPKPPVTTPTVPATTPGPVPSTPPNPTPTAPKPPGFSGTWAGNGGCGFSSIAIVDQGNTLLVQGLPGNGNVVATSDGTHAQAQGVVMFGEPNHQVTMVLQGNQLSFQASSSTGSCSDSLSRH